MLGSVSTQIMEHPIGEHYRLAEGPAGHRGRHEDRVACRGRPDQGAGGQHGLTAGLSRALASGLTAGACLGPGARGPGPRADLPGAHRARRADHTEHLRHGQVPAALSATGSSKPRSSASGRTITRSTAPTRCGASCGVRDEDIGVARHRELRKERAQLAPLRCSTELTVSPAADPHARDGCDQRNATGTSNTDDSSASPGVRSFPADVRSPAASTTSADFCPVSPHLTMRAVGAATPQHNRHPGRSPRIRTITFPLRPPRLRCDPVGGDGLHLLQQAHPDRPAFYAIHVPRCRVSPRASSPPRLTTTQLPPASS